MIGLFRCARGSDRKVVITFRICQSSNEWEWESPSPLFSPPPPPPLFSFLCRWIGGATAPKCYLQIKCISRSWNTRVHPARRNSYFLQILQIADTKCGTRYSYTNTAKFIICMVSSVSADNRCGSSEDVLWSCRKYGKALRIAFLCRLSRAGTR